MNTISFFAIDIVIGFVVLVSLICGWVRGATKEILSVISWFGSVYLAYSIFPLAKNIFRKHISHGLIADFSTICVLFILFLTLLSLINYFCSNFIKKSMLNTTDKAVGAIFGIVRGAIILAIVDLLVVQCYFSTPPEIVENSRLRPYIANISTYILIILPDEIQEKFVSTLSQAKKQSILEFLKDDIFKNDDSIHDNSHEVEAIEHVESAEEILEFNINEEQTPGLTQRQSAETLAELKPRKLPEEQVIKKNKFQEKNERLDMGRFLDQYDDIDE